MQPEDAKMLHKGSLEVNMWSKSCIRFSYVRSVHNTVRESWLDALCVMSVLFVLSSSPNDDFNSSCSRTGSTKEFEKENHCISGVSVTANSVFALFQVPFHKLIHLKIMLIRRATIRARTWGWGQHQVIDNLDVAVWCDSHLQFCSLACTFCPVVCLAQANTEVVKSVLDYLNLFWDVPPPTCPYIINDAGHWWDGPWSEMGCTLYLHTGIVMTKICILILFLHFLALWQTLDSE